MVRGSFNIDRFRSHRNLVIFYYNIEEVRQKETWNVLHTTKKREKFASGGKKI